MNDQQIFEYIAIKQPARAVQLADKFDVALCDVSASLKSLVDVGDLVRSSGVGPNGQQAQFYSLSETFKKSREGKLVVARLEDQAASAQAMQQLIAEQAAAPAPTSPPVSENPAPAPAPTPPAAATKSESPATAAGASRVELAIACIRERGSVPDADLRQVMNLRAGQYPSAWLTAAVKDGRLCKDGRNWTLGTGAAPAPLRKQPAFGGSLGLPGATPRIPEDKVAQQGFVEAAAQEVAEKIAHAATACVVGEPGPAAPAAPAPVTFRCGLWSDGVLELQRNGVTVAQLDECEGATVADFMARLQQPGAAIV